MTKHLLIILIAFYPTSAFSGAFDLVKVDELYIDYKNFSILNANNRYLLIYPEPAKESLSLGLNLDIFDYFALDSEVLGVTSDAQYRGVGLKVDFGFRLSQHLYLGFHHLSQHVLDRPGSAVLPFTVEDAIEFKWTIIRGRPGRDALF